MHIEFALSFAFLAHIESTRYIGKQYKVVLNLPFIISRDFVTISLMVGFARRTLVSVFGSLGCFDTLLVWVVVIICRSK
jgi:hypothetical protein